mmetsp:Transcript_36652/g.59118  ORF Transcript_36652/g.59118 Transcript_36652/m.59118 type:complete len:116 (+) Transcript_36652:291-638(+)
MIYESNYGATKVVGWGDGNKFSGFKGTSYGAPMVKIRRHAQKNDTYVNPGRAPRGTRKWTRSVQYVLIENVPAVAYAIPRTHIGPGPQILTLMAITGELKRFMNILALVPGIATS